MVEKKKRQRPQSSVRSSREEKNTVRSEVLHNRPGGQQRLTSVSPEPLHGYLRFEHDSRERLFHHILDSYPSGVCVIDAKLFLYLNSAMARLLGYRSPTALLGKEFWRSVDPGSKKILSAIIQRTRRSEQLQPQIEVRFLTQSTEKIDTEVTTTLITLDHQSYVLCFVSDMTHRKAAERRRSESEHLRRNIVDSMSDALIVTDLEGRILDVNVVFEVLTGYGRKDVFGMQIPYPWVPEEHLGSYLHWLEELRESKVSHDFDVLWNTKSGKKLFMSINTTLLKNASGDPVLMLNLARDISERQQAREALHQQVQRLEVLYTLTRALTEAMDSSQIAKITCEQLLKVIPFDAFFIEIYDKHQNTVRPLYIVDVIQGKRVELPVPTTAIPLAKTVASQKVIQEQKPFLEMRSADAGSPHYEPFGNVRKAAKSLLYVPMLSKEQAIGVLSVQSFRENAYIEEQIPLIQSIASVVAIALQKTLLYRETIEKSREIEERNRELDDFTYVVSHDLKEPLISVEGYSKILKSEYYRVLNSNGQGYLTAVLEATSSMKILIDELLLLSRVGKVTERKVSVNLSKLLGEVLAELRFSIAEKKALIREETRLPTVTANEAHLKIVFRNLLSNALKFCDNQVPHIVIGALEEGEFVSIYVRDNGIGIEQQYHEKIFKIFQRLHKKDRFSGTGAGLTIVKKIVESFGGKVWLESQVGVGTTFYFSLPLQSRGGTGR